MSKTSQAKDRINNGQRWQETHEATEARARVRELNAEQASAAKPFDVGNFQHTLHVLAKNGLDRDGNRIPTAKEKSAVRKAWQLRRRTSAVRRHAEPVVQALEGSYVRLSNGVRRRASALGHVVGKPFHVAA